ncbi:lactosylceramide alpha-2,3-sialyltransferase isoform X4 [Pantherophis guttatus]|uniref:Lactosylceramide alpha-2,3-sialyltransferase n=1 Tax=Pantherophis guttatus TaxID=94885 RepID=A0A6P9BWN9_PANGU|nr:lactosylceramide alpha-2,3-sialyltransferase isoform X4 [Pantherophis guttatus]
MKRPFAPKEAAGVLEHVRCWLLMKMKRSAGSLKSNFKCIVVVVIALCFIYLVKTTYESKTCETARIDKVNPDHAKRAQKYAEGILQAKCRPSFAKTKLNELFPNKYNPDLLPFVTEDIDAQSDLFKYQPPFGFRNLLEKLRDLVQLLPEQDLPAELHSKSCKHCVVVGSSNVLHGLKLGSYLNHFDIVIRLNDAPVWGYTNDVGNKTTIRMTYPEGASLSQDEYFPDSLFVAVLFKTVDFEWIKAVVKNETLKIPTIGIIAMVLATHLCDEVSLAGFGYDLHHPEAPLHYYNNVCTVAMRWQPMHDVTQETQLLQKLVREGAVSDLSGGIYCHFCNKPG